VKVEGLPLASLLADSKRTVVKKWFEWTLKTYPESTTGFLGREKDPFRNPVGHRLQESLSTIFDGIVQSAATSTIQPVLDDIVRIRAVQDFTAGQAVAFVFFLKKIVREELPNAVTQFPGELAALEARIDQLALLAFDLFMSCRERIYEIKANEAKRIVTQFMRVQQENWPE
jgi:hypothetical protein